MEKSLVITTALLIFLTLLFIFLLGVNFDKSINELYFILIFFVLVKFIKDQILIAILSIRYLKLCIKNKFMDQKVSNI